MNRTWTSLRPTNGWVIGEFHYMGGPIFWSGEKLEKLSHGAVFNMLFVDGHTASVKTNILFKDEADYLRRWNNDNLP